MSFVHGKSTSILLDGADLSAYFRSAEFSVDVDTAESTTFGSSWKSFIPGLASGVYELGGLFDATQVAAWHTIQAAANVLTVGPSGTALGAPVRLMHPIAQSYKESAPIGDVVSADWGVQGDSSTGFGHVIAARVAVTADANGAAFDYTAQSTNGGIGHLHVFSVSTADSIVVTIEDSSTGSSGWATIGTFASKSAAGAERILISGTIKRYVRAVYDVTGTGVSIEVAVALARL